MGYLKLKKASNAIDLIPADGIIHVSGVAGVGSTSRPTAKIVYNTVAFGTTGASEYLELNVTIGGEYAQPAAGAVALIEDAINNAIVKAASQMEPVEVDFSNTIGASTATAADGGLVHAVAIGEAAASV